VDGRLALAAVAGRRADAVVVTSDDACARELGEMAPGFVEEAARGGATVLLEADRHRAIQRACGAARAGDVVVIAGKALSPTQRLGEVQMPWDDRVHVRSALGGLGHVGGDI
jgi:UDP-N-acetylmuramoyl-L-alanyl-D-glutamate--2,6-diaminopimelate ligase